VYQLELAKTIFADLVNDSPFTLPVARDDHSFGGGLDTFESVTGH